MTRRRFGMLLASGAAALTAAPGACLAALRRARFVQAVRGRFFPGRVRPLDDAAVRTPGRWGG